MSDASNANPGPGISLSLARQRSAAIKHLAYGLKLEIPEAPDLPLAGQVLITLELAEGSDWPPLDFAPDWPGLSPDACVTRVAVNGSPASYVLGNGHVVVTEPRPNANSNQIEISFVSGKSGVTRRPGLVYSLFVPARAHCVFPCFDQPDLKASLQLSLEIPSAWRAMANTPIAESATRSGRSLLRFAASAKLPTYLFAFVVGRIEITEASIGGRELSLAYLADDVTERAEQHADILQLQADALAFLETYTGLPYSFTKFGLALLPDFEFSGMEHPGAVFYRADTLLIGRNDRISAQLRRAILIAHETAHCWFGDLVTMPWFDETWIKEACANFMADKFVAQRFPDTDHATEFFLRHFPAAYGVDRTAAAHPIIQSLDNLANASEVYDALIYHKAPIAMAALEHEIGAAAMRTGLRDYLTDFPLGNAGWAALRARLEAAAATDLKNFSAQWLEACGRPIYPQNIGAADRFAYGWRGLSETQARRAIETLATPASLDQQAQCWVWLYEAMLDGEIAPARLFAAADAALAIAADDSLLERILSDAKEIFWRYLTPTERAGAAESIERTISGLLNQAAAQASHSSSALLWLDALADFALSSTAWRMLGAIRDGADTRFEAIPAPLAGKLTLLHALHCGEGSATIESKLLARAVSSQPATRDELFADLLEDGIEPQPAVKALALLNHPLRAEHALRYLEPGIAKVADFAARNQIFYPRQWLLALFAGHGTQEATRIIRAGLDSKNLEPGLRRVILETADPVFRAAAIRA